MTDIHTPHRPRWTAEITYRHITYDHIHAVEFDELHELHDIIESGPNFATIGKIEIHYNFKHLTIEEAMRQ